MGRGERPLVNKLNRHFHESSIQAFAYRHIQAKGHNQLCDINVDSRLHEWYLAIEVKSLKVGKYLNFKDYFSTDKNGKHQLERLCEFANNTGRIPLVCLFVYRSTRAYDSYTFDAFELNELRHGGKKSIKPNEFEQYDIGWYEDIGRTQDI